MLGRSRFHDVGFGGGDDRDGPVDNVVRDSGVLHGIRQVPGNSGEIIAADAEAVVCLVQRPTVVVVRAAEHFGHQEDLVTLESRKINLFELRRELWVAENTFVEVIHDSAHGRPAANNLVITHSPASRLFTHGLLILPPREANHPR